MLVGQAMLSVLQLILAAILTHTVFLFLFRVTDGWTCCGVIESGVWHGPSASTVASPHPRHAHFPASPLALGM